MKRSFKLDEFTLDDLLIKEPDQDSTNSKLGWTSDQEAAGDELVRSRTLSNCGKARVAAGASGYLRLSCMDGTAVKGPAVASLALDESNLNLLRQLKNAQYRRLNSDFELLVDTLTSPTAAARPRV